MSASVKDLLFSLCSGASASGCEYLFADETIKLLGGFMPCGVDKSGNIIGHRDGSGTHFLLDAHFDVISLIVTGVEKNGFLRFDKCGGIDVRTLCAQDVIVHGKEELYGVVTSTPPHLMKSDGKSAPGVDEILIDTGIDGDRIFDLVSPGDRVTFKAPYRSLIGSNVSGAYFDNRSGVCAVLKCLEILKENGCDNELSVVFSSQEETGRSGAYAAGYNIDAEKCICVDVSFAKSESTPKNISAVTGGGTMIGIAPILDYQMSREMQTIAKKEGIPYQLEVMADSTGTNADMLAVSSGGKKTALLSIPLKNMHTCSELLCLDDIEATARLMAAYIMNCGGDSNA